MPVDIDVDPLRLKEALRDFVALSAIPAVSVGREPEAVAAGLADSLVEVLQLDFAFVRMSDPGGGVAAIEVTRGSARTNFREWLERHVGPISSGASHEVALDLGDGSGPCNGIAIPIGVNGRSGLVVAASERSGFPSAIDRVLLSLTAYHAAIAFENARLIQARDQAEEGLRQARDELEARVVERTAELNVANEELSALRRVATLVAEAAAPSAILDAVAGELQALLDADQVALNRFEPDAEIVVLAHRGLDVERTSVGSRVSHEGENVTSIVRRTGSPARMENYEEAGGALAELARATGLRSSVSAPITVEGQVWGVVTASWKGDEAPPADTEDRMAKFAHLIDTAMANTESREALGRLADEQAAQRRVATLVAQAVDHGEIFGAVAEEVAGLFDLPWVGIMRYDSGDSFRVLATWGDHPFRAGSRWPLDGPSTFEMVLRTGRAARIEDYTGLSGTVAEAARKAGIVGGIGAPIVVEGKTWGVIAAPVTTDGAIPDGAEIQLTLFTELVATAIANAESRAGLARLAEEQAALHRVATLVAHGVLSEEVFAAVSEGVGRLLGTELAGMARFGRHDTVTVLATWAAEGEVSQAHPLVSGPWPLEGGDLASMIWSSGRPVRIDDYHGIPGRIAAFVRDELGVCSSVASPIVVEGQLWGTLFVHSKQSHQPLPQDTESRLTGFTELVATAIANSESREALKRLAEEQGTLRRMATLVARGVPPADIFSAVCEEAGRLVGSDTAAVVRFEHDPPAIVVVGVGQSIPGIPIGTRSELGDGLASTEVYRTERSARIDARDWASVGGPLHEPGRRVGLSSTVASPISVEGRLWGTLSVSATAPLPLDTEERLEQFSALVATAIANAESREALSELVDEQAALRRVATLVAEGVPSAELFSGVTKEVANVFSDPDPALVASVIRFDPGPESVLVGASRAYEHEPLGARWAPKDLYVSTRVLRTGRSARVGESDLDISGGSEADVLRLRGFLYQVGSPVVVEGELWGAMCLNSKQELPPDTDERLESFTALVATAIANAESREARAVLTDEQAALRRVAVLVAEESSQEKIFGAVTENVGPLLGADIAAMHVFTGDGTATVVAGWSAEGPMLPIGTTLALDEDSVAARIFRTGASAYLDSYEGVEGQTAEAARDLKLRSTVGAPIVVDGKLWGALVAATRQTVLQPVEGERRIAAFTELVATAISNAQAREQVTALADEQAALRRVATLVAQGVQPNQIFSAVSAEVSLLFDASSAVLRFDDDGPAVVHMGAARFDVPVGTRGEFEEGMASGEVYRTGRPARWDDMDWSSATGEFGAWGRRLGFVSSVVSPIVVEGRLWGGILVATRDESLPPDTENRLERFTELVATAIANAESRSELAASRRRIVAASDETRRRIERDLHDGVQQQLVSLGLELGVMKADRPPGDVLKEQLASVTADVGSVLDALVEIARGIHPAILSQGGLAAALNSLARRSAVPVDVDAQIDVRVPDEVEVAAYYVASEALTNVAKHARASNAQIDVTTDDGTLTLVVRDDGVGGAALGDGSGLIGLQDRVEALGGTITIDSSAGNGTRVAVTLPIASNPNQETESF